MLKIIYLNIVLRVGDHFQKWVNLKKTLIFLAVPILLQCKSGTGEYETGELAEIDVTQNYPRKEFYLQDIGEVEYIPFETNNNALMGRSLTVFYVSDDYIIAANNREGDIFVYNGNGKWKYTFNHKGQGPMEYVRASSIAFDEMAQEIFVCNWFPVNPQILVYAENGDYKRTLSCPPNFWPNIYNFDEETLLVYDEYGIFMMEGYSNKPYLFMSKKDGSITDNVNIHLPVRLSNVAVSTFEENGQPVMHSRGVHISYNRSYGKNFLIADWSADTIYRLTPQKELQPMMVRKPPMQSTDPKILLSNFLVTDKFILLGVHGMDYDAIRNGRDISQKQLMYDFGTGEIYVYRLQDKNITTPTNIMIMDAITPENTGITLYNSVFLFDMDKKGALSGDLKELLKTLDEEDNPVLVKIKFL